MQLQKHYAHIYQHGWVVSNWVLHSYYNINQLPISTSTSEANFQGWLVQPYCGGRCLLDHGKGWKIWYTCDQLYQFQPQLTSLPSLQTKMMWLYLRYGHLCLIDTVLCCTIAS